MNKNKINQLGKAFMAELKKSKVKLFKSPNFIVKSLNRKLKTKIEKYKNNEMRKLGDGKIDTVRSSTIDYIMRQSFRDKYKYLKSILDLSENVTLEFKRKIDRIWFKRLESSLKSK